jgi:hypothetical protein
MLVLETKCVIMFKISIEKIGETLARQLQEFRRKWIDEIKMDLKQ